SGGKVTRKDPGPLGRESNQEASWTSREGTSPGSILDLSREGTSPGSILDLSREGTSPGSILDLSREGTSPATTLDFSGGRVTREKSWTSWTGGVSRGRRRSALLRPPRARR